MLSCAAAMVQHSKLFCMGLMRTAAGNDDDYDSDDRQDCGQDGVVTVVATPIWFSAAMMPGPRMNTEAMFASSLP